MRYERTLQLEAREANAERRTVPCVVASETPVRRYLDGQRVLEVLQCDRRAVDLSRAPLPLLVSHDGSQVNVGLVEDLSVRGRKVRGTLRLGKSPRANELWPDIQAGIIRGLSVGYEINEITPPDENDVLLVTRWTPFEVSIVGIPADPNAGTFRSAHTMIDTVKQPAAVASRSERREAKRLSVEAIGERTKERERVEELLHLGERFNCQELARRAIADGSSAAKVKAAILDQQASRTPGAVPPSHAPELGGDYSFDSRGMPVRVGAGASDGFSILRAVRALVDPTQRDEARHEFAVSRQLAEELGRKPKSGILVPIGELTGQRTLTAGAGGGANLVGTTHLSANFVELLRARSVVMRLAPLMLTGLVGDVSIPRQTSTASAQWISGEGGDSITASDPSFDGITLSPKTCGALTVLSRRFILQADPAGEDVVRRDLAASLATALDVAVLAGTGTSNQPRGIINTSGIATDDFNAATPTWAEVVAMESALLAANVDPAGAAYLTTPTIAGLLKVQESAAGSGNFIWQPGAERGEGVVNGYPAMISASCPAGKVILGNWSDLVLGFWRAIEIETNPFHDFAAGTISLRAFLHVDVAVRHAESFAVYSQPG